MPARPRVTITMLLEQEGPVTMQLPSHWVTYDPGKKRPLERVSKNWIPAMKLPKIAPVLARDPKNPPDVVPAEVKPPEQPYAPALEGLVQPVALRISASLNEVGPLGEWYEMLKGLIASSMGIAEPRASMNARISKILNGRSTPQLPCDKVHNRHCKQKDDGGGVDRQQAVVREGGHDPRDDDTPKLGVQGSGGSRRAGHH